MSDRFPPSPQFESDQLNEILQSRGGIFWFMGEHPESTYKTFQVIVSRFDQYVGYAKSNLYNVKPREICFGFVANSELNAFAYASPPEHSTAFDFIGMNVGVVFTMLSVFRRILSHPENFPDVGDAAAEVKPPAIGYLATDAMRSGQMNWV